MKVDDQQSCTNASSHIWLESAHASFSHGRDLVMVMTMALGLLSKTWKDSSFTLTHEHGAVCFPQVPMY